MWILTWPALVTSEILSSEKRLQTMQLKVTSFSKVSKQLPCAFFHTCACTLKLAVSARGELNHTCVEFVIAKLLRSGWDLASHPVLHNFQQVYLFSTKNSFFSLRWEKWCYEYINNDVLRVCLGQPHSFGGLGLCHVLLLPPLQQPHPGHAAAQRKEAGLRALALTPQVRQV